MKEMHERLDLYERTFSRAEQREKEEKQELLRKKQREEMERWI